MSNASPPDRAAGYPPIVLLTDFGLRDPYVGEVKGRLYALVPGVPVIDLCHDLPPFAIRTGSWLIGRCLPHMPRRALWLGIVDPGIGSCRRVLGLSRGETLFIGPDNGLFSSLFCQEGIRVYALDALPVSGASRTFRGRDHFPLLASRLLHGTPLEELGSPVSDMVRLADAGWRVIDGGWETEIMLIDHFGNLITALPGEHLGGETLRCQVGNGSCRGLVDTFSSLPPGEAGCLIGSFDTLEIVVNQGSAADRFGARPGDTLRVTLETNPEVP
ncbi:MAG: SAM-dependent chlorinase/fluorinase [Magnetococcales bacterium]|nr:SAM-dependent chlorinase/fluorinase [Magnetococcales bacterium]